MSEGACPECPDAPVFRSPMRPFPSRVGDMVGTQLLARVSRSSGRQMGHCEKDHAGRLCEGMCVSRDMTAGKIESSSHPLIHVLCCTPCPSQQHASL